MSYTLKGRVQSRLVAALLPLVVACGLAVGLPAWWPLGLAALMLGVGLTLDVLVYDLIDYQPGWLALPLGLVELALVMGLVRALDFTPPLAGALAFFLGAWLLSQALAHAGYPLFWLAYAERGGELGRAGTAALGVAAVTLSAAGATAWAMQPPTVRLAAGVHQGPLVLDRPQRLVGEPGTVIAGGIVIRANHVIVRDVTVEGGEYGIDVDNAHHVLLERVHVRGARLDGIHVRRSRVSIRDCEIVSASGGFTQGIDISFSLHRGMSVVERCLVRGGQQGIVTHSAMVMVRHNEVRETTLRGIDMTEMSMGEIHRNRVSDTLGIGIFCGDYSHCEIDDNSVSDVRPDHASGDTARMGVAIQSHYWAQATLGDNTISRSPGGIGAFVGGTIERK